LHGIWAEQFFLKMYCTYTLLNQTKLIIEENLSLISKCNDSWPDFAYVSAEFRIIKTPTLKNWRVNTDKENYFNKQK